MARMGRWSKRWRVRFGLITSGYAPGLDTGCPQIASTYDWRLSVANMERRDNYFSRLQDQIELLHKLKKEKVQQTAPWIRALNS